MEQYIFQILTGIVGIIAIVFAKYGTDLLKAKIGKEEIQNWLDKVKVVQEWVYSNEMLADLVVRWAEQLHGNLPGKEQFAKAKAEFIRLAAVRGIEVSEEDIDLFIEKSVLQMKLAWNKEWNK